MKWKSVNVELALLVQLLYISNYKLPARRVFPSSENGFSTVLSKFENVLFFWGGGDEGEEGF